jgi:hypothetical protein
METKSIIRYIHFGGQWMFIQRAVAGQTCKTIINRINNVIEYLDEFNLMVTKRAAWKLINFRDEIVKHDETALLTHEEAEKINQIVLNLTPTLLAESEGNLAYIVTDKRLDINKLLSDVSALFAPKVYGSLSDIAKYDFKESGRCVAFQLPTAAAFHLLRGTEEVLRAFYLFTVKRNRISQLLWGPIIAELRKRRTPPPAPLLDNLDNIRRSFRNPTQHPEKVYDIQEAQDLFALCIDVVNRMAQLMK